MQLSARERIQHLIESHPVVLFMKGSRGRPACGFSAKAVEVLDALLPNYFAVDVLQDPELRDGIKSYSNWPTIPQLYIRGEFVGGSDIVLALFESGELEEKLGDLTRPSTPRITLSPRAASELRAALEEPGEAVRFDVTPAFQHDLAVGVPDPRDVIADVSGVKIAIARSAVSRADGVHIDVIDTPDGLAFKIQNPNEPAKVKRISPQELKQRLAAGPEFLLVDVRTPQEQAIASLPNSRLLDPSLLEELEKQPKETTLVLYCHHGMRSQRAAEQFVADGFRDVYNLTGGIEAWSLEVDPSVPRY
jgi:monothiol glutaredoxin